MLLSVVVPVYNEEESLPQLLAALRKVLELIGSEYEIVFVNDGSCDGTARLLREEARRDRCVKVLHFSRNFGHQAALTAGLDFAAGDAVVVMDADLQHPPDLLPEMLRLYREGFDVVSAQRRSRTSDGPVKRATSAAFYWLMRKAVDRRLPAQVPDFRLFSREAVQAIRGLREQHRFLRGLVAWLGLREAIVPFDQTPRAAGRSKYRLAGMLRFAWTAVSSFSALPLRLSLFAGLLATLAGAAYFIYILYATFVTKATVPGWSSLACLQIVFSGLMLIAIGLVGEYVARLYEEVKQRPLYVVTEANNIARPPDEPSRAVLLREAIHAADSPPCEAPADQHRVDTANVGPAAERSP